jgi:hypothetical protein
MMRAVVGEWVKRDSVTLVNTLNGWTIVAVEGAYSIRDEYDELAGDRVGCDMSEFRTLAQAKKQAASFMKQLAKRGA